jgi:hypothetical protein
MDGDDKDMAFPGETEEVASIGRVMLHHESKLLGGNNIERMLGEDGEDLSHPFYVLVVILDVGPFFKVFHILQLLARVRINHRAWGFIYKFLIVWLTSCYTNAMDSPVRPSPLVPAFLKF